MPTVAEICDAVDTELGEALVAAGVLIVSQNYDELTEGMNDPGVLQIYPESEGLTDSLSGFGQTQQMTFGEDGLIQEEIIIHADYYAKQRANIGDDMAVLIPGIEAIRDKIKEQKCPPFGLTGIRTFQWSWERTVWEYGQPELKYIGARFILRMRLF